MSMIIEASVFGGSGSQACLQRCSARWGHGPGNRFTDRGTARGDALVRCAQVWYRRILSRCPNGDGKQGEVLLVRSEEHPLEHSATGKSGCKWNGSAAALRRAPNSGGFTGAAKAIGIASTSR